MQSIGVANAVCPPECWISFPALTVQETGLPNGSAWSVSVSNGSWSAQTSNSTESTLTAWVIQSTSMSTSVSGMWLNFTIPNATAGTTVFLPSPAFGEVYFNGDSPPVLNVTFVGPDEPTEGGTNGTFCSPASFESLGSVLSTPENLSVAVETAEASAGFAAASGALGENQSLNLTSTFLTWNFSGNTCSPKVLSENLVFTIWNASIPSGSLIVNESENLTFVSGTSLTFDSLSHAPTAPWSGWTFPFGGSDGVGGIWQEPTVAVPANHCDADPDGACDLSLWMGESPGAGGTGGLAQTGVDGIIECEVVVPLLLYACETWYTAWYQFLGVGLTVSCGSLGVSSGDWMTALVTSTGGEYGTELIDDSSHRGCTASSTLPGGADEYSEIMAETPIAVVDGNDAYNTHTPAFGSVVFNSLTVGGETDLPPWPHSKSNEVASVAVGSILYGTGPCTVNGQPTSCFKISHT